jgi:hypothetical protein
VKHDKELAFTENCIDPRRYMVFWAGNVREGCFIRWTWYYPCHNEVIG